jgi:glycosyltransferase involved in cell wall biosynthesis
LSKNPHKWRYQPTGGRKYLYSYAIDWSYCALGGCGIYRDHSIAVIVPAYKEELLIGETLSSIPAFIDVIYAINDASPDRTGDIIDEYARADARIIPIHHPENRGVGAAIMSGYARTSEDGIDIAVVMAGDNQMDPKYIPSLVDPIINNTADYTKGNRLYGEGFRKGMSAWRTLGNALLTFLTKVACGYWHLMDPQNGYTAISRRVLERDQINDIYPGYGYCNNLLVWLNIQGFRVKDIPIPARYGTEKSGIRYSTYIPRVSWLLLTNFMWRMKEKYVFLEFHPLVLFYFAGSIFTLLGFLGGLYSLYFKFIEGGPFFVRATLSLLVLIIGFNLLLFAMFFDMEVNRNLNGGRGI